MLSSLLVHHVLSNLEERVFFLLDPPSARLGQIEVVVLCDITFTDVLLSALPTLEVLLQLARVDVASSHYCAEDDD